MPEVTVAIPTLRAGSNLEACLLSLAAQTWKDFEVIVVDNSGGSAARRTSPSATNHCILDMPWNVGFGVALNHAIRRSTSPLVVALNDDTVVHPGWLQALVETSREHASAGMFAPQIRLFGSDLLDSAGMLVCADGSSKQRGRMQPAAAFNQGTEALFPSGCAAMYRRSMLDRIGLFDEDFFLYCEDTDLGLRAQWAGWQCRYVPEAVVEHRYSSSAGAQSRLKAHYVERNRLRIAIHHFPAALLAGAPLAAIERYRWHSSRQAVDRMDFSRWTGAFIIAAAHLDLLRYLPAGFRRRREVQRIASIGAGDFARLIRLHSIAPKDLAVGS